MNELVSFLILFIDSAIRLSIAFVIALIIVARIRSKREGKHYNWLDVIFRDDDS